MTPTSEGREIIPALDLVGTSEVAARAGIRPNTVSVWRRRHRDFPAPLVTLASGPVWSWPEVQAWLAHPRPPGRPRTIGPEPATLSDSGGRAAGRR